MIALALFQIIIIFPQTIAKAMLFSPNNNSLKHIKHSHTQTFVQSLTLTFGKNPTPDFVTTNQNIQPVKFQGK